MSIGSLGGTGALIRQHQPPSFSSIDKDASGGITLDEMQSGAKTDKDAERAAKLFAVMDSDSNGAVSTDEKDSFDKKLSAQRQSMQFTTQLLAGSAPPSKDDIFAATDKDGSGSVSLDEFSSSDAAYGLTEDQLQTLFSAIDGDSDGAISATESSDALDALQSLVGGPGGPGGPPPGGGPRGPGGPPPGDPPPSDSAESDDSEEDSDTLALDLLTAAKSAYAANSGSNDLLSVLSSVFDTAA